MADPNVASSMTNSRRAKPKKRTPTAYELRRIGERARAKGGKPTAGQIRSTWQRDVQKQDAGKAKPFTPPGRVVGPTPAPVRPSATSPKLLPVPPGLAKKALGLQSARTLAPGRVSSGAPGAPDSTTGARPGRPGPVKPGGIASGLTTRAAPQPPSRMANKRRSYT